MSRRLLALAPLLVLSLAVTAGAQPATRRLTTIDSLRQFPNYFHLQNVLVRGEFAENGTQIVLRSDDHDIRVLMGDLRTTTGLVEVRAQLLDVGRLEPGDPRLTRYENAPRDAERWPKPGEELLLNVTGVTSVDTATTPTVRALALEPWKFDGQSVTVTGQFRGRNLFGDAPGAPAKSRYDFVLRAGDGAIWVTGLRPRGRGFDLNVDTRVDTNRWVQVTGVLRRERTLVFLEAKTITAATAPTEQTTVADDEPPPVPLQPAAVVFSSPTEGETDVPTSAVIRLQFSRGLTPASIEGSIRVTYGGAQAAQPPLEFQTAYDLGNRAVTIRLTRPPERFSTVVVETLPTLKAFDGAPVTPWKLTFIVGGS